MFSYAPMTPTPVRTPLKPSSAPEVSYSDDEDMDDSEVEDLLKSPGIEVLEEDAKVEVNISDLKNVKEVLSLPKESPPLAQQPLSSSGAESGATEPSDRGGLAVNRSRRLCTMKSQSMPSRSRSLSTTSSRLGKGAGGAKNSIEDSSLKALVPSKRKPDCQKKVSDYFPKN